MPFPYPKIKPLSHYLNPNNKSQW
ncbi:hypothetical protein CY0110_18897 [Crocosphaera chwakensis CCY0110]|uniref:Uncharacterized protein n=1 Tax=Crocosphaera chwakensis CCY0110 TaxID=391612 RepID=A3IJB1_9CHRO|nr:hypothetical protein CY0110_18897 [Crocosphaera chwakensis CCY0110]